MDIPEAHSAPDTGEGRDRTPRRTATVSIGVASLDPTVSSTAEIFIEPIPIEALQRRLDDLAIDIGSLGRGPT